MVPITDLPWFEAANEQVPARSTGGSRSGYVKRSIVVVVHEAAKIILLGASKNSVGDRRMRI
jgi:hypothetical protein